MNGMEKPLSAADVLRIAFDSVKVQSSAPGWSDVAGCIQVHVWERVTVFMYMLVLTGGHDFKLQ